MKKYMAGKDAAVPARAVAGRRHQRVRILNDNDWFPLATLIIGLPDEKEEDMLQTLELMDKLKDYNAFPCTTLLCATCKTAFNEAEGCRNGFTSKARWDFFIKCWEYNVKIWKPTFLKPTATSTKHTKHLTKCYPILRQNIRRILRFNTRSKRTAIQRSSLPTQHANARQRPKGKGKN